MRKLREQQHDASTIHCASRNGTSARTSAPKRSRISAACRAPSSAHSRTAAAGSSICKVSSTSTATQRASATRMSSGGITIGTITKMISKASSTKAHSPITPSTTADDRNIAAGNAGDPVGDQLVGAEHAQHQRKRRGGDQQREQRAGDRHRVVQNLAQHGAAQAAGEQPAARTARRRPSPPLRPHRNIRWRRRRAAPAGRPAQRRRGSLRCGVGASRRAGGSRLAAAGRRARRATRQSTRKSPAGAQRAVEDVLRVDDAVGAAGRGDRNGVGVEHRVAEQDEHQRGRDHARRACWRPRPARRASAAGTPCGGEPRRDHAREAEHARADRAVHRPEQRAEHHAGDERRRRPARQDRRGRCDRAPRRPAGGRAAGP